MSESVLSVVDVPAAPTKEGGRRLPRFFLGLILPLGLLLLLETASRLGLTPPHLLPAPSEVFQTLIELGRNGLGTHIVASVLRVLAGFAMGAGLGLAVAVAVGLSRRLEEILDPSFQALRAVPSLAWVPLLLLWLGIDETPKIVLIAIGAFFPVYLNVVSGLRNVDRKLVELGETYGLTSYGLARRILLPAALPSIFTGLRTSLSLAWMFLVAAELIAATRGLGYLLTDGRETSRPDIVIAAILLLAVLGKLSDGLLKSLEERALRWRDSYDEQMNERQEKTT
jgi:sulfonate transport system permease protein